MNISNCCEGEVQAERGDEGICMACGEPCTTHEEYDPYTEYRNEAVNNLNS